MLKGYVNLTPDCNNYFENDSWVDLALKVALIEEITNYTLWSVVSKALKTKAVIGFVCHSSYSGWLKVALKTSYFLKNPSIWVIGLSFATMDELLNLRLLPPFYRAKKSIKKMIDVGLILLK